MKISGANCRNFQVGAAYWRILEASPAGRIPQCHVLDADVAAATEMDKPRALPLAVHFWECSAVAVDGSGADNRYVLRAFCEDKALEAEVLEAG